VTSQTWATVLHSLEFTKAPLLYVDVWFPNAIGVARSGQCQGFTLRALDQVLGALRANHKWADQPGRKGRSEHIAGLIALAETKPEVALEHFNLALPDTSDRGMPLAQAAALGSAGYPELGLKHLAFASEHPIVTAPASGMGRLNQWVLQQQGYWEHETDVMRNTLTADATARRTAQAAP
jgi:hypothetical protein